MRVMVLHGSPRRGGNSDTLAEQFVKGVKQTGDVEVIDFILNDMNISPCQGCESCMTSEGHRCVIDDDMHCCMGDSNVLGIHDSPDEDGTGQNGSTRYGP
jgi:multimeric flavodoxin WrbA